MRDDVLRPSQPENLGAQDARFIGSVRGPISLMEVAPGPGQPVDPGNPGEIAAIDLAQRAFRTLPQDDPRRHCPDESRTEHLLGRNPAADLPKDLTLTSRHLRDPIASGAPPRALANPETQVDRPHS